MKRLLVLFALCLFVWPPAALSAPAKGHPVPSQGQDCVECHGSQEKAWLNGKHGLMTVKCIVCHGSTEENFARVPGLAACRGCHADEVAQAAKAKGKEEKNCFSCHDRHSLTVAKKSGKAYHSKGGK